MYIYIYKYAAYNVYIYISPIVFSMVILYLPPVYQKKHPLLENIERRSRLWRRIEARGERPQGGLAPKSLEHRFPSEKWWIQ